MTHEMTHEKSYEILIFADDEKRVLQIDNFPGNRFILNLLGIKQYETSFKLNTTKVHRDVNDNIIYFRDIIPLYASDWDLYMKAIRFNHFNDSDIDRLIKILNILGGDDELESLIHEKLKKNAEKKIKLYPEKPSEDEFNSYTWKITSARLMANSAYFKDYTITKPVYNHIISSALQEEDIIFWMRKYNY